MVSHWCVTNNPKISQLALIIYCAHKSQSGQSLTRTAQFCSTWHQSGWFHWAWKTHIQGGSQHSWRAETACQLGLSTEGLSSSQETRLREAWASFTAWELDSKNPGGSCKVSYDLALEAPECLFHHVPWGRQITKVSPDSREGYKIPLVHKRKESAATLNQNLKPKSTTRGFGQLSHASAPCGNGTSWDSRALSAWSTHRKEAWSRPSVPEQPETCSASSVTWAENEDLLSEATEILRSPVHSSQADYNRVQNCIL